MQKNSPIQENGRFPIHQLLNFALVFFVLCTLGLIAVFYERPTISETEKRELAKLPEFSAEALFAGTYTRDLSAFFADTFPLREQFVGLAGAIRENGACGMTTSASTRVRRAIWSRLRRRRIRLPLFQKKPPRTRTAVPPPRPRRPLFPTTGRRG